MYAREIDGQKLTFAVSGKLWGNSLVMIDQETRSLWSHVLGDAREGPLKGTHLPQIPSVMTTWERWRSHHPEGTVMIMPRSALEYTRDIYVPPDRYVLGIVWEGKATAWGLDTLVGEPVQQHNLGSTPIVVMFDILSATPRIYDRRVEGKTLTFELKDRRVVDGETQVIDRETKSTWDIIDGTAISGELKGIKLTALPGIVSYRNVWERFHPVEETPEGELEKAGSK